jgi:uncharacterized membrane protein YbaN (DUF454 family)
MRTIIKVVLIIVGIISMSLGVMGIFLPVLPTTPFLLLAAACFIRSSEKLYNFLIQNKYFGKYIKDYREGKGIPKRTKVLAIGLLWISIGASLTFVITKLFLRIILAVVAILVTVHIARIKTKEASEEALIDEG